MRRLLGLLILVLALVAPARPALALADDVYVPPRPAGQTYLPGKTPLYDQYEIGAYVYDARRDGTTISYNETPVYMALNSVMITKAWLMKTAIRTVEYATAVDFLTVLEENVGAVVEAINGLLWADGRALVTGALSLVGLLALLAWLGGRTTRAWGLLGGTVITLVVSVGLFSEDGLGLLKLAGGEAREVAASVYAAIDRVGTPAGEERLAVTGGDAAWRAFVYQPWVTGQFSETTGINPLTYLAKSSRDRHAGTDFCMQSVDNAMATDIWLKCPWYQNDHLPHRILLALGTFTGTLIYAGTLVALAGGMLVSQIWFLFLVALLPLWSLLALWWPGGGPLIARHVALRAVGALLNQTLLAAALGFLLMLTRTVPTVFSDRGWVLQALFMTLAAVAAFAFRFRWLGSFSLLTGRREAVAVERGLLGELRSLMDRRPRQAVATADRAAEAVAAIAAAREPLPAFTTVVEAPAVHVEVPRAADLPGQPRPDEGSFRPAAQQDLFLTQMRVLRHQLEERGEVAQARSGRPGSNGWEEPTPTPAPGEGTSRAVRQPAKAEEGRTLPRRPKA